MATDIQYEKILDTAKLSAMHKMILFWCTLIIIFDGYDLVIYGVVLPKLMTAWELSPVVAGYMGSAALFGMMFGAVLFGALADKLGRKNVIMICVLLFSGFTVLNGFAQNPWQFGIIRFIAGLGIGGAMPNVVAMMTQFSPKKIRSTMTAVMFSGYSIGGILSALLGMYFVPTFGWEIMFYLAGIPLLMLPFLYKMMPESLAFLVKHNRQAEARSLLQRLDPSLSINPDDRLVGVAQVASEQRSSALFTNGRGLSTLMFWVAFFMMLLMVYGLNSWLPKLMANAGYGFSSSLMFLLFMNIGAIFGAIGGGWLGDRFNIKSVIIAFCVIATASVFFLGTKNSPAVLYFIVAVAGATTIGTTILMYAYVGQFYPGAIRSTGIGMASGVGRLGGIFGPTLGGYLLSLALPHQTNFLVFAIPGIIAAVAILLTAQRLSEANRVVAPQPAV